MTRFKIHQPLIWLVIYIMILFASCSNDKAGDLKKDYSPITQQLVDMVENNAELKSLLTEAIKKGKAINPDKETNPAQTLEEYYDFIEWSTTAMPWSVLKQPDGVSLYDKIDQSLDYFYFINDIPLEQLDGKGLYNNSLQYIEPYRTWLINYCKEWGKYLSTPDSWKSEYAQTVQKDPSFGLQNGWYESSENWHSFNDFFCRYLSSPDMRPIAEPDNDAIVSSPADSKPQGVWNIDANSDIVQKEGVAIKSKVFNSVAKLIGEQSAYANSFAGGVLTHSFLDVNDYHRYHFPMSGVIKELKVIAADDAAGGFLTWDAEKKKYMLACDVPGWQSIETRGLAVIETADYGLVALMPIGMSQVSSVNFEKNLKVGDTVKKGDMLGYFLFGGSDFVLIFQKGISFSLSVPQENAAYKHLLMGEELGRLTK